AIAVLEREREHLLGHVEAVDLARGTYPARRKERVGARSRAEVEDRLAGAKVGHGRRDAAAQAGAQGLLRNRLRVAVLVQRRTERAFPAARRAAPAPGCTGRCRVSLPNPLAHVFAHVVPPEVSNTPDSRPRAL